MTVRWSSIHAQLGLTPAELTYDMIADAVANHVAEDSRLDWKAVVPTNDHLKEEFVKDVAAMANSSGGIIAYGIAEDGNGRADQMKHVDNSDSTQRTLRSLASSRISPPVAGIEMIPFTSPDQKHAVLIVSVPRSPEAPHFIGDPQKSLGVPFRNGTQTDWLREPAIERAYRDRFTRQADQRERLVAMIEEIKEQVDLFPKAWIIGVARPHTPLVTSLAVPSRSGATSTIQAGLRRCLDVLPNTDPARIDVLGALNDDAVLNPRVGLRRWVVRNTDQEKPFGRSGYVHLELHHDGSVGLGTALDDMAPTNPIDGTPVPCPIVESFTADFVGLVTTYAEHTGQQGPYELRVEVVRSTQPSPYYPFVAIEPKHSSFGGHIVGNIINRAGTRNVTRIAPVSGEVPVNSDTDTLRTVARDFACDILNQFGVEKLWLLS